VSDIDVYQALIGGTPTDADKQATLVNALRRQRNLGQMNMISGDPVLNPMGAAMMKGADTQAVDLGSNRLQAQQLAQSAAYQQGETANRQAERQHAEAVLAESIREHNLQNKQKMLELGEDDNGDPNSKINDIATKIAHYDLPPITAYGMKNPRNLNIMSAASQINPNYDATQYSAKKKAISDFGSGPLGNQARRFNVGLAHLDTLDKLIDAMGNGDIKAVNMLKNAWQTQTGKPAPDNFSAAADLAADEVAGAIVGQGKSAGALADREKIQAKYSADKSPAILKSNNNVYRSLMSDQMRGLEHQYQAATQLDDFRTRYLDPETRKLLSDQDAAKASAGADDSGSKTSPSGWAIKLVQ
jgi:hypothetical protein